MKKKFLSAALIGAASAMMLFGLASCSSSKTDDASESSAASSTEVASSTNTIKDATITINNADSVYDGKEVVANYTTDSDGAVTVKWYKGEKELTSAPTAVGTYKLVVSTEATANYKAASAEKTFAIKDTGVFTDTKEAFDNAVDATVNALNVTVFTNDYSGADMATENTKIQYNEDRALYTYVNKTTNEATGYDAEWYGEKEMHEYTGSSLENLSIHDSSETYYSLFARETYVENMHAGYLIFSGLFLFSESGSLYENAVYEGNGKYTISKEIAITSLVTLKSATITMKGGYVTSIQAEYLDSSDIVDVDATISDIDSTEIPVDLYADVKGKTFIANMNYEIDGNPTAADLATGMVQNQMLLKFTFDSANQKVTIDNSGSVDTYNYTQTGNIITVAAGTEIKLKLKDDKLYYTDGTLYPGDSTIYYEFMVKDTASVSLSEKTYRFNGEYFNTMDDSEETGEYIKNHNEFVLTFETDEDDNLNCEYQYNEIKGTSAVTVDGNIITMQINGYDCTFLYNDNHIYTESFELFSGDGEASEIVYSLILDELTNDVAGRRYYGSTVYSAISGNMSATLTDEEKKSLQNLTDWMIEFGEDGEVKLTMDGVTYTNYSYIQDGIYVTVTNNEAGLPLDFRASKDYLLLVTTIGEKTVRYTFDETPKIPEVLGQKNYAETSLTDYILSSTDLSKITSLYIQFTVNDDTNAYFGVKDSSDNVIEEYNGVYEVIGNHVYFDKDSDGTYDYYFVIEDTKLISDNITIKVSDTESLEVYSMRFIID